MLDDGFARFGDFAIAAALAAKSTITEPGAIPFTISSVTSTGAFYRNHRRCNHYIAFLDGFSEQLALTPVKSSPCAVGIRERLARLSPRWEFDEASAKTLHLLLHGGLKSYADVTAPSGAKSRCLSPATPHPITNTRAGVMVPPRW